VNSEEEEEGEDAEAAAVASGCCREEDTGVFGWEGVEVVVVVAVAVVVVGVRRKGEPVCVVDGVRMPGGGEEAVEVAMLSCVSAFYVKSSVIPKHVNMHTWHGMTEVGA
jgi:hypothetical protein